MRPLIESHLNWFLRHAPMRGYGPLDAGLWMSSLDLASGRAAGPDRPSGIQKRCYRFIESPLGSNLYWDLPLVAFCFQFSEVTGNQLYRRAAEQYVSDYLRLATGDSGLFYWGNHYYIQAASGKVVWFIGEELIDAPPPSTYHETRPLRVPWELFRGKALAEAGRSIRAQAGTHVVDPQTGEFNRHSDRRAEHPFLEAGGVLVESLAWGGVEFQDPALLELAERISSFSFDAGDPVTGLLPVSPRRERWDKYTSTSEVGQWAGCLIKAAQWSGRRSFREKAGTALAAWLNRAWSENDRQFFGRLDCKTGQPDLGEKSTVYQPPRFSDLWEPLFPCHDYPFVTAQTCVDLFENGADPVFAQGIERWLTHCESQWPPREGRGGYAEHYGRALHFLVSAGEAGFGGRVGPLLERTLADVKKHLIAGERIRSHPGEDRCDAVDGMGFLLWSLLEVAEGRRMRGPFDPF